MTSSGVRNEPPLFCINLVAAQLTPLRRQRGLGCSGIAALVKRLKCPLQSHCEEQPSADLHRFAGGVTFERRQRGALAFPIARSAGVSPRLPATKSPARGRAIANKTS